MCWRNGMSGSGDELKFLGIDLFAEPLELQPDNHYFILPVLAKYMAKKYFYFEAGPEFEFLLQAIFPLLLKVIGIFGKFCYF